MTTMTTSSNVHNQDLLVLPRSDLNLNGSTAANKNNTNKSNKRTNAGTTAATQERPSSSSSSGNLVLMRLPPKSTSKDGEDDRPSHIIADTERATLMTKSGKSYSLVKVGTSNTLILWNPNNGKTDNNAVTNGTGAAGTSSAEEEPQSKRQKVSSDSHRQNVQLCHLVVPGGSGSHFMICQPRKAEVLETLLRKACSEPTFFPARTQELIDTWHFSKEEIYSTMRKQSNMIGMSPEGDDSNKMKMWHMLSEEEIWQGRTAVTQTICEEYDIPVGDDDGILVVMDEMKQRIYERLVPFFNLPEQENRIRAIADQYCHLATKVDNGTNANGDSEHRHLQPKTTNQWILQDLLIRGSLSQKVLVDDKEVGNNRTKTTTPSKRKSSSNTWLWSSIEDAWKTRIPLCWEKYVSLETLQDVFSANNIQITPYEEKDHHNDDDKLVMLDL